MVLLCGGVSVPLPALRLALELENRGCYLRLEDTKLVVGPRTLLTDADRAAIRQWVEDLKQVVRYERQGLVT